MNANRQHLINNLAYLTGTLLAQCNHPEPEFLLGVQRTIQALEAYQRTASQRTIVDLHDEDEDDEL